MLFSVSSLTAPVFLFAWVSPLPGGHLNLTAACNAECGCLQEIYSPVCGSDDIMYYSPCHAGCKKMSENLRNGKKVGLKERRINKVVACLLWSVLAGSAEVSTGLSFAADQSKRLARGGCSQATPGMKAEGTLRSPCLASLNATSWFCFAPGQTALKSTVNHSGRQGPW